MVGWLTNTWSAEKKENGEKSAQSLKNQYCISSACGLPELSDMCPELRRELKAGGGDLQMISRVMEPPQKKVKSLQAEFNSTLFMVFSAG